MEEQEELCLHNHGCKGSCVLNVEKRNLNLSIDLFTRVSINTDTNVGIDTIDTLDQSAHTYSVEKREAQGWDGF